MKAQRQAFFPTNPRYLQEYRWLNIALRTLHLVGIAGIGGGYLYLVEGERKSGAIRYVVFRQSP